MNISKHTFNLFFWITFLLYCIFCAFNICNYKDLHKAIFGFSILFVLELIHRINTRDFEDFILKTGIILLFLAPSPPVIIKKYFYHYHGVSIIRPATIVYVENERNSHWSRLEYKDYSSSKFVRITGLVQYEKGSSIYICQTLECKSRIVEEYKDSVRYPLINKFAFLDDTTFYTYHDFSLVKPDLVYYQVGYNVLYNAVCDTSAITDSTALLSFTDVVGKGQTVKYSVKGYPSIPDTFLIYRNINENIDSKWHVCAPEVNTPENRAKISDYGYIFHYDVCSKQEIESQCPRIKDYVEQYKKRNQ